MLSKLRIIACPDKTKSCIFSTWVSLNLYKKSTDQEIRMSHFYGAPVPA